MIGYKAFEHDFTCRGFQYEVGKTYEIEGEIELCRRGFHFCGVIGDCFGYYEQSDARFAKIEALGKVIESDEDSKCVTDKIKILEEIPRDEAARMTNSGNGNSGLYNSGNRNSGNRNSGSGNSGNGNSGHKNSGHGNSGNRNSGGHNSGDYNSGYWNSGSGNSGHYNSGHYNTGYRNTGNFNTGNWNTGDWNTGRCNSGDWNKSSHNTGCFMTVKTAIMMFNKPTIWTFDDWWNSDARKVMQNCPVEYTRSEWVTLYNMTDEEREAHPDHKTTRGYLKTENHKADRQAWWDGLPAKDKQTVMNLPNFDADVFYECTGIRVKTEDE